MAFPEHADHVINGAGIHGFSAAWKPAEQSIDMDEGVEGRVVILDKSDISAGASGIACGVAQQLFPARNEAAGATFDHLHENTTVIADSNLARKMPGVGHLIADEDLAQQYELLEPFLFDRFENGELHPVSTCRP